eukprot:CAMPEP_0181093370 /NCGR_PEP_ID=MMETSP1071-20121207/9410_1 /TAXON_ID=35127 /ORGANISM="Thalassiosira sp., Strain NH16" /LENGTH=139 /DNA_ID=CAMNT_0023175601 /DNA_START=79 /DNA_END=498 /DNA_ORIENTATION=-
MVKFTLLVVSVLAATTSAQLARAPERVRNAKNNAVLKSSSKNHEGGAFGRKSSSGLRNGGVDHRELQLMSMDADVGETEAGGIITDDPEQNTGGADCSEQDVSSCTGGQVCVYRLNGLLCSGLLTIPFFCSGFCEDPDP